MQSATAKEARIAGGKLRTWLDRRLVQPYHNEFAACPQNQKGHRCEQRPWLEQREQQPDPRRRGRHPIEIAIDRSSPGAHLALFSRFPFQKPLVSYYASNQRAHYRVQREQRLMRKEYDGEQHVDVRGIEPA